MATTRYRVLATVLAVSNAAAPAGRAQSYERGGAAAQSNDSADPAALERELADATALLERLGEEARRLDAEAEGLGPRRDALTRRARAEIRMLYHLSQAQSLAVQGGPESVLDHAARADRVRRALHATLRELEGSARRVTTVRVDRVRIEASAADARVRQASLESRRARAVTVAELHPPAPGTDGLGVVPLAGSPLAAPAADAVTVYGGSVAVTGGREATFADAAGRLLFPVAGRAEVRRARRQGAEGPGVEIVAAMGTPVRAVFPGRVAFADRYGTYGRIVILDHGDHHYTVSANLGTMNVRVGGEVATGAVLGTVGDDGRGPMLYFEVRRGSETVDPAPWLGL